MVDLDGILAFGGDTSSYDEYVVGLRCVQFGSFIDTLLLMGQSGSRKSTIFGHLLNAVAKANVGANSSKVVEMTSDGKHKQHSMNETPITGNTKSMPTMICKSHQTQVNISSSRSAVIVIITANGGGRLRIMDFFGEESSLHSGLNDNASNSL